ncbi:hypothetical protein GH714_022219 [Hevea brasiliensis]|uniref:Uncharacterized protein n=1 Tax=Hevea brasiliensis TaxID=3981 RepID=A0A6A6NJH3_HEVBR|nr:hypothetical protein GH714_022219 [Hevea brasiliensis]
MAAHLRRQNRNVTVLNPAQAWPAPTRGNASSSSLQYRPNLNPASSNSRSSAGGPALSSYASSVQVQAQARPVLVHGHLSTGSSGNLGNTNSIGHSVLAPNLSESKSLRPSISDFPPVSSTQIRKMPPSGNVLQNVEDIQTANKSLVEKIRAALECDEDKYAFLKTFLDSIVRKQKELVDTYNASLRGNGAQENGQGRGSGNLKTSTSSKKGKEMDGEGSSSKDRLADDIISTVRTMQSHYKPTEDEVEVLLKDGYRSAKGMAYLMGDEKQVEFSNQDDSTSAGTISNQNVKEGDLEISIERKPQSFIGQMEAIKQLEDYLFVVFGRKGEVINSFNNLILVDASWRSKAMLNIPAVGGKVSSDCFDCNYLATSNPFQFAYFRVQEGTGSHMLFYNLEAVKIIESFQVFQGIRVHGITCGFVDYPEGSSSSRLDFKVVVFGEKRVKLFNLHIEIALKSQNQPQVCVDLALLHSLPRIMQPLQMRRETIALPSDAVITLSVSGISQERCLLYSMRLWGDNLETLRIASGTIYNEIIIWKVVPQHGALPLTSTLEDHMPLKNSCSKAFHLHCQQHKAVHISRLIGHEGSIFRIVWSSDGSKLVSVSDDRSARIWAVKAEQKDSSNQEGEIAGPVLFGHNARIWDCCISGSLIVTAGEDCTCRVWRLDGKQLNLIKEHIKSEYVRCLHFTCGDVFTLPQTMVLYHAQLFQTQGVKWTKLVQVGEKVPIVCMDLLNKKLPRQSCGVDDWLLWEMTGGDGCLCYFEYDRDRQSLEFIGMKQVKGLSLIESVSNNKSSPYDFANCGYAIGFASTDFIIWNLATQAKVLQIPCGDGDVLIVIILVMYQRWTPILHMLRKTKNIDKIGGMTKNVANMEIDVKSVSLLQEKGETESKGFLDDKDEDDWRYLAVTAFLVKCTGSRLTVCFIAVACSDATLALRALVLPHRLWYLFDVALLVPLLSPVLSLQQVVIPTHLPSGETTWIGNVYIVISGATDGSIAFWDLTDCIESFMRQLSVLDIKKLKNCQTRPRTGRGSQGGRWWRSLKVPCLSKQKLADDLVAPKAEERTSCNLVNHSTGGASTSDAESCTTVCSQTMHDKPPLEPGVNNVDSTPGISEIQPLHVLNNVHQSGFNKWGDDQTLHCIKFDLSLLTTGKDSEINIKDSAHCSEFPIKKYRIRFLCHDRVTSAHSSAIKGVWTDGTWVFSTGLDQRIRCWVLKEHCKLIEQTHLVVSCRSQKHYVPEPVKGTSMKLWLLEEECKWLSSWHPSHGCYNWYWQFCVIPIEGFDIEVNYVVCTGAYYSCSFFNGPSAVTRS